MWARLQADLNCNLRRGAWYRLLKVGGLEALVDVRGRPVPIVKAFLQISDSPPRRWTVVPRPRNVPALRANVGSPYAVCPSCRDRVALHGHPRRMLCQRCRVDFEVAWDERYLAEAL